MAILEVKALGKQYQLGEQHIDALVGVDFQYYLALGAHLVKQGSLDTVQDIFYLTDCEVRRLAQGNIPDYDHRPQIAHHKIEMERYRDVELPTVIYGDDEPPVAARSAEKLSGLATSIGHYTGQVKVVRGIQDFGKVQEGDVLVIPYSDVGWSPLFARAGAVVAESGGLLSHSSIIAREYGIPAVVSVIGAMNLPDFLCVTVDGHKGEVIIHSAQ